MLLRRVTGGGSRRHGAPNVRRIGRVHQQRVGQDRDVVTEGGRDLVRVTSAADIAQQGDPVGGPAQLLVEARIAAQLRRQEARPEL